MKQDVCLLTITVNIVGVLMEKQIDWNLLLQVVMFGCEFQLAASVFHRPETEK